MRIFSIITAIAVCAVLYLVIMERDLLVSFAQQFERETGEDVADVPEVIETPSFELASDAEEDSGVSVVVLRSLAEEVNSAVVLRGRTEAVRQVDVRSETSGLITSEPIRAGAFVEAGTLLCEIAPGTRAASLAEAVAGLAEAQARLPESEARVAEAQARLAEAAINNNAATRLSESGFASETRAVSTAASVSAAEASISAAQAGVEAAISGIQSAEAAVDRAEQEIERLRIHAPFAGHLESDTAEIGSFMQTGALCATVIELETIKLVGFVPEANVERVQVGAPAGARLASGAEVQGVVSFVSRSADPQTRTFRVEITVENRDYQIRDGQTADILIGSAGQMAHLLPSSALTLNDEGILGLRLVDENNITRFAPVEFLRDTVNGVLLGGLPDQADVIVVGQEFVNEGVAVDPHYQELTQ